MRASSVPSDRPTANPANVYSSVLRNAAGISAAMSLAACALKKLVPTFSQSIASATATRTATSSRYWASRNARWRRDAGSVPGAGVDVVVTSAVRRARLGRGGVRAHRGGADVLGVEVVVGAVLADPRQRVVDLVEQRGVALLHAEAVLLPGGEVGADLEALGHVRAEHGDVVHDRVDLAGLERLDLQAEVLELDRLQAVVGGPGLAGRRLLHADRLPLQRLDAVEVRALRDQQALVGVEVRVGEVDLLLALRRDGDAGRDHVAVVRVEVRARLDALERGHLRGERDAQVGGDLVDDRDVEADDLAVLLVLERLVRRVGAEGEGAVGDELDPALGRGGVVAAAAAGGEQQRRRDGGGQGGEGAGAHG